MNGYDLSRSFWDWSFENPEKVRPIHSAIYFFAIEHCNRLGWKDKFGFPSQMVMEAIGIKKHQAYIRALNELEEFGAITFIQRSKNQYSSNIISLNALPKMGEALGKARSWHGVRHGHSTGRGTVDIDKPNNLITKEPNNCSFSEFWDLYHSATGKRKTSKAGAEKYWIRLSPGEKEMAIKNLEDWASAQSDDPKFICKARTYLSDKRFNDEIDSHVPYSLPVNS